jgi:lipoic acid synthetase
MPAGSNFHQLRSLIRDGDLHTVCEEAHCPNIGDCWDRLTATFMILGDTCTWRCHYCAVKTGRPSPLDSGEPERLARTVKHLGLRYVVITSVNRGDLPDGGAAMFAECISRIRHYLPTCKIEVLTPDFRGNKEALATVLEARPDVLNHNIETVKRIFRSVRPQGDYARSLRFLELSSLMAPDIPTKSGMMVGLGETVDEIRETMMDLRNSGCHLLTIGQYLRPSLVHFPLEKYYHPDEFAALQRYGMRLGFRHVASGPLVRSSYHADEQAAAARIVDLTGSR